MMCASQRDGRLQVAAKEGNRMVVPWLLQEGVDVKIGHLTVATILRNV